MRKIFNISFPLFMLFIAIGEIWGQETEEKVTFEHSQGTLADDYEWVKDQEYYASYDTISNTDDNKTLLQRTHEYTKIIYVEPGKEKQLIPYNIISGMYRNKYFRWFMYEDENNTTWLTDNTDIEDLTFKNDANEEVKTYMPSNAGYIVSEVIPNDEHVYNLNHPTLTSHYCNTNEPYIPTLTLEENDFNNDGSPIKVALDISNEAFTIEETEDGKKSVTEPTLAYRYIFEIRDAGEIMDKITSLDEATKQAYIDGVRRRLYATAGVDFQVRLTLPLSSYYFEDVQGEDETTSGGYLTKGDVTVVVTNEEGETVTDINASIYNTGNWKRILPNELLEISDPKEGTYTVTIKHRNYALDEYEITFLPESEAGMFEPTSNDDNYYKSQTYLDSEVEAGNAQLLGAIDFDGEEYSSHLVEKSNYKYYPAPLLPWSQSSYAWVFNGSYSGWDYAHYRIVTNSNGVPQKTGLTDGKVVYGHGATEGSDDCFLWINVAGDPGKMLDLEWNDPVCPSSRLYLTFWMNEFSNNDETGNVEVTLTGINDEGTDEETRTEIATYITGYIANDGYEIERGTWAQVYFSFITGDEQYDKYVLTINNNAKNSAGADFAIDDIRVYMAAPRARVTQQKLSCGDRTRLRMDLTWDQLLSRMGQEEQTEGGEEEGWVDFCFIDETIYNAYLADHENDPNKYEDAIDSAAIRIGNGTDYNQKFATLYYDLCLTANTKYVAYDQNEEETNSDYTGGSLASANSKKGEDGETRYYFYYSQDEDTKRDILSVDFYADMMYGRNYVMLIRNPDTPDGTPDDDLSSFGYPGQTCAIATNFTVIGQNLIRINGEIVKPEDLNDYCTGQIFNFSVDLQTPQRNGDGSLVVEDGEVQYDTYDETVYFDWFIGTMEEFNKELSDALETLRKDHPDATEADLGDIMPDDTESDLAKAITTIQEYLEEGEEEGIQKRLTLHKETLSIRILENGLNLVVRPIGNVSEEEDEVRNLICWDAIPLRLDAKGESPSVLPGFEDVTYPTDFIPNVRLGLEQIEKAKVGKGNPTIKISLRDAHYINESTDHLGVMTNGSNEINELHFVGSTDPNYTKLFDGEFDKHAYCIGKIVNLKAKEEPTEVDDNMLEIQFNLDKQEETVDGFQFTPREGYSYTFGFHFEEKDASNDPIEADATAGEGTSDDEIKVGCYGSSFITMYVVPKYQKWIGEATDDCNNDDNWARSTKTELKKADGTYTDDEEAGGYAPMYFTNITIREDKPQIELYNVQKLTDNKTLDLSTREGAKENIEYDLMVEPNENEDGYHCIPYYMNRVNQIHFEPNAEMLHAELLQYDTAWVDYKLENGKWHTLASPLQGVVAGDFYTDSDDATEKQEYFTPITFVNDENDGANRENDGVNYNNDNIENSRFSPSVYQRGWDKEAKMVSVGETEGTSLAIQGNWSAVYNNVYEAYNPGKGFSIKVLDMPKNSNTEAIFRLPKNDDSYSYYDSKGNETETSASSITREGAGKLKITTPEENAEKDVLFTVTDLEANGNYYLVGNPFMAYLDTKKFFEANSSLGSSYWYVDDDVQNIVSVADDQLFSTDKGINIPPLHSFFVRKVDDTSPITVTFKDDMQVLGETSNKEINANALILTVQTEDGKTSRAAIAYDMSADKGYAADEDVELFLDSNLSDVSAIYTVAGTMATSINRTSELYNIPIGIYGNSTEMVTLSFVGLKHFSSAALYDAEKKTETPLREGTTLTVPASTSGRYFLRAGTPTGNEILEADDIQIYALSGNRVMVASSVPLKDIRVYNLGGVLLKQAMAGFCSCELYLPDGIYIVKVENVNREIETAKVVVR